MAKKRSRQDDDDGGEEEVDLENRDNRSYDDTGDMEEEEDGDGHRSRHSRRKKKRFKVMQSSGQTDEERRLLRRRQRELKTDIVMGAASGSNGTAGEGSVEKSNSGEQLERLRDQNNELWKIVHYTREAVLDSENVDLLANKATREAEKIVQVPRYDAIRLAQSLVKKGTIRSGSSSRFNWHGLGFQVGVCYNALPTNVSFLYGPLDAEYTPKNRKKPERHKKQSQEEAESENEEEEQPEDVDQTGKKKGSDGNELSAVEQHIKVIRKTLYSRARDNKKDAIERSREYETKLSQDLDDEELIQKKTRDFVNQNSQVNAVNCLFNPNSFTQTVENIFHFSFMVKSGDAGIKTRTTKEAKEFGGEPGPAIQPIEDEEKRPEPKQAIVSLNMKDWRDMCRAYSVEESDVPHRVHGKVAKKEKKERKSH